MPGIRAVGREWTYRRLRLVYDHVGVEAGHLQLAADLAIRDINVYGLRRAVGVRPHVGAVLTTVRW